MIHYIVFYDLNKLKDHYERLYESNKKRRKKKRI